MAKKFKAIITPDAKIILGKGNSFEKAQEFTLSGKAFNNNIRQKNKVGKEFTIKEDNQFIQNNSEIKNARFNQDLRDKANSLGEKKKGRIASLFGFGGKKKDDKKQQNVQSKATKRIESFRGDRPVSDFEKVSGEKAAEKIFLKDFKDPQVAKAFQDWAKVKKIDDKEDPRGFRYEAFQEKAVIADAYNNYKKLQRAVKNSEVYRKQGDPEKILEEYNDAALGASRIPDEVMKLKSVGGSNFYKGTNFFTRGRLYTSRTPGGGLMGTLYYNYAEASRTTGYGIADQAFQKRWWGRPSAAAQIQESNLEATKIAAEADVEEAKALKEEGKERSARAKSNRIAEIAADKKASASFLNTITGGLFGRPSLADLKVQAERAQAEAAVKTAKAEGKAAEESAQSVRRAIKVQSGAFGARERAQKLEARELDRLEERIAEGRPISKADQNRLKFLRDFSEESPTSFTRGETQVRSVVAPDEATVRAAQGFLERKRGAKR